MVRITARLIVGIFMLAAFVFVLVAGFGWALDDLLAGKYIAAGLVAAGTVLAIFLLIVIMAALAPKRRSPGEKER